MSDAEPQSAVPKATPRWYRITPDRVVIALLAVEVLLWLSDWFHWLPWHKGYAVLTAVALVVAALVGMFLWFAVALIFRWRFQFSIRLLLVLTVAIAVPCSWLSWEMKKAQRQKEVVEEIERLYGSDRVGYEVGNPGGLPGTKPTSPAWLFDFVECHALAKVSAIHLECTQVTDNELDHLQSLEHLIFLDLSFTNVTAEGVKKLKNALPKCKIFWEPLTDERQSPVAPDQLH